MKNVDLTQPHAVDAGLAENYYVFVLRHQQKPLT
jgi:hypothetical protein